MINSSMALLCYFSNHNLTVVQIKVTEASDTKKPSLLLYLPSPPRNFYAPSPDGLLRHVRSWDESQSWEFKILVLNTSSMHIFGPWQNCMLPGQRPYELCSPSNAFSSFVTRFVWGFVCKSANILQRPIPCQPSRCGPGTSWFNVSLPN